MKFVARLIAVSVLASSAYAIPAQATEVECGTPAKDAVYETVVHPAVPANEPPVVEKDRVYPAFYYTDKCGTANDRITRVGTSKFYTGKISDNKKSVTFTVTDAEKYYFLVDGEQVSEATFLGTFTNKPCKTKPVVDKPVNDGPNKPTTAPEKPADNKVDQTPTKPVKAAVLPNTGVSGESLLLAGLAALLIAGGLVLLRRR